jgi:hypothetical protein
VYLATGKHKMDKCDALLFIGTIQEFHPLMQVFTVMCTLLERLMSIANAKIEVINQSSP